MARTFNFIVVSAASFLVLAISPALAVSSNVKGACKSDYFAHCSKHALESPGLRNCMRSIGPRLSDPCLSALMSAGEMSKADARRYAARPAGKR